MILMAVVVQIYCRSIVSQACKEIGLLLADHGYLVDQLLSAPDFD